MKSTLVKIINWTPSPQLNFLFNILGINLIISFLWDLILRIFFFVFKKKQNLLSEIERKQLEENGFLEISNFMEENDFIHLNNLIKNKTKELSPDILDFSYTIQTFNKVKLDTEILKKYFGRSSDLHKSIQFISGIKSKIQPPIEYRIIKNNKERLESYADLQDKLHKDVFYNSYKAILYLNDINKNNGAFVYATGSSKTSLLNFFHNYINGVFGIKNYEKVYKNIKKKDLEAKANTLIIMNAKGLHQRGKFYSKGERKTLFIDFRYFHSLYNLKSLF